ncbi:hypothetical protein K788_0003273 [Paraburkholderia caribensis MBA4]|uniref:Uncharacterized protein n=1 Tax=Paraburkholderia caribensis MBA4 TaxID=1323664 RepID=A0A0P0RCD1_9BURK|nr:DUF5677 domain-containing protein [Paraburkholderia caribensis]ALL66142.1 hypothetical protein K788_0003273 [Paraburkholderia caribensis MBA4]
MTDADEYSLDAVVDDARLGNDPSPEYMERVHVLDNVVRDCMFVSQRYAGIRAPSSRHYYASVLFTALITRGVSLISLIPHSPWASKVIEHWDYASATGIVRTMLELRLAFYYLCVDECSADEWQCRWNLFNLHDCVSRRRLFEARGAEQAELDAFEMQAEELRSRLRGNAFFGNLPASQQRKLLHGQTAYLLSLEDIGEKAGVDKGTFRFLYVLFSSHVHGLPMSFYRIGAGDEERGRGLPSPVEERYTSLCLSSASSLLVRTRDEVHTLFKEFARPPNEPNTEGKERVEADVPDANALPVGHSIDLVTTDTIRIEVTRTRSNAVDVTYYYRPTNEAVLKRSDSEDGGTVLHSFDATFWTVIVNGGPATGRMLEGIETKRLAFKVNADTRTLSFKMELDATEATPP